MLNIVLLMDTSTVPGDCSQTLLLLEPLLESLPSLELGCAMVAIHAFAQLHLLVDLAVDSPMDTSTSPEDSSQILHLLGPGWNSGFA